MSRNTVQKKWEPRRIEHLLTRVRVKQLETALRGRLEDSFRYAARAWRIRRIAGA